MEIFNVDKFSFKYPLKTRYALENVDLKVNKGDFIVLCGESGSGKSTLLKSLKPSLAPYGTRKGQILFKSKDIKNIDKFDDIKIGYVLQNPDNQIVTDKVWHELAFGLENLGLNQSDIRLKVGEMASFFGIDSWFHRDTNTLSGGEKQILNLASIMALNPEILILDEPTSQLDPIATRDFISMLKRINDDLGTTIIVSEHRLDDLINLSDRVVILEDGRKIFDDRKENLLNLRENKIYKSFPVTLRLFDKLDIDRTVFTVKEAKKLLSNYELIQAKEFEKKKVKDKIISLKEIHFRYNKNSEDVLENLSLDIERASVNTILGGNGSGKSTCLKLIKGILKAHRGTIKYEGKKITDNTDILYLPQEPEILFTKDSLTEELGDVDKELIEWAELEHLMDYHPYDLSGGEKQRLALIKVLAKKPKVLLLDEVTKGMDAAFKEKLGKAFSNWTESGMTIIMVSHDIEFSSEYSDRVSLFFDKKAIITDESREFFKGNTFYTSVINRVMRDHIWDIINLKDVDYICKKKI